MSKKIIAITLLTLATMSSAYAAGQAFTCPKPNEIQSTDFTSPSIWVTPGVQGAAEGTVGVGLGGKKVQRFIGAEAAEVNHQQGWVCVYETQGGMSVDEYRNHILKTFHGNDYLRKYYSRVNDEIEKGYTYLKDFPHDSPIGFVGFQAATNNNKKK
jgi:hypothetical protein